MACLLSIEYVYNGKALKELATNIWLPVELGKHLNTIFYGIPENYSAY